jgi:amino acid transporter
VTLVDVPTDERQAGRQGAPPPPAARPVAAVLPETLGYKVKNKLLGPPLHTAELAHERLGKPTALAVFASDNLSSSAYATEEILRVLVPAIGLFAFSLVVPITVALLIVLGFLILSYRQTIKEYPSAGGAYIVTKDNFGLIPAQVAGVALLTDYVLTVSVSVAAGTAAVASAFSAIAPFTLEISVALVALIALGNLRGVKESGRLFAVPTYFFILDMVLLVGVGVFKLATGRLGTVPDAAIRAQHGIVKLGAHGADGALLAGAGVYVVMHAFASGGAAVTGVEAISNGVPAFRPPEWKNARSTLVVMGSLLGAMFLGLSVMAAKIHVVPFVSGTPTVISQVGAAVFGGGAVGRVLYYALQAGTALILILAANTSFADFPRLASFHAGDNFMPRQLTKRGHRLVFSNGIIGLSVAAVVVLVVTDAKVDRLIPLYAIGVFTSFTLSQAGMTRHHFRKKEPGWRRGAFVNGTGAALSLIVDVVIAITKFTHGAWVIIVLVPIMVFLLTRLNKQYEAEAGELQDEAKQAAAQPILRRHVVLVLVDDLDRATARAIQYARALMPNELQAIHFVVDEQRAEALSADWRRLGLARLTLQLVDCPDRRIVRAALEAAAEAAGDGGTEVSVLLPRLEHKRIWHRLLHDRTADAIAEGLAPLAHVNVTFVPFHLGRDHHDATVDAVLGRTRVVAAPGAASGDDGGAADRSSSALAGRPPVGGSGIAAARFRQRVTLVGRVKSLRVQPWSGVATLEAVLADEHGAISVVFLGRRHIAGLRVGIRLEVEGMVGQRKGQLAMLNPSYRFLPD